MRGVCACIWGQGWWGLRVGVVVTWDGRRGEGSLPCDLLHPVKLLSRFVLHTMLLLLPTVPLPYPEALPPHMYWTHTTALTSASTSPHPTPPAQPDLQARPRQVPQHITDPSCLSLHSVSFPPLLTLSSLLFSLFLPPKPHFHSLTFKQPDHAKYPSMKLAYAAGRAGGTMTGVLSAANEQVGPGFTIGVRGLMCDRT